MTAWNELPRLAVGSHQAGAHRGCIMNVISWANGDSTITDMPACTHPVLARAAQVVNDRICSHSDGEFLCSDCSAVMYGYEPLLVGTAPPEDEHEAKVLAVTLAVSVRRFVEPLWRPADRKVSAAAFGAAEAWLDCPCAKHAAAAYAAADAASATAYAGAYAAAYAAANAAANAAAYAASAASNAAYAAANAAYARRVLDHLIDVYYSHTGKTRPKPNIERVAAACRLAGMTR